MYAVYILYSRKLDKFYVGSSADVSGRLRRHNSHSKGFTSAGRPWILLYTEEFAEKQEAETREKQLKRWKNRERLEALINKGSEHPASAGWRIGRVVGSIPTSPTEKSSADAGLFCLMNIGNLSGKPRNLLEFGNLV